MKEVRGYPNHNYTDRDIGLEPLEMNAQILVDDDKFFELISKATALDILTADIKRKLDYGHSYSLVDDDLVLAVTGMNVYQAKKKAEEEAAKKAAEEEQDGQA